MELAAKLVRTNRRNLALLLLSSLLSGALNAGFLAIITYSLTKNNEGHHSVALIFVVICLAILAIRHGHRYLAINAVNKISNKLRIELIRIIQSCSAIRLEQQGRSALLTVLTVDINTIASFILALPLLMSHITFLIGATIYLIYISDFFLFSWMATVTVIAIFLHLRLMSHANGLFKKSRKQHEKIMGHYNDAVDGYKEIKMNAAMGNGLVHNYVDPVGTKMAKIRLEAGMRHSLGLNFGQATIYALIGLVIFVFPTWVGYDPGLLLGYTIAIIYAAGPLESVLASYPTFAHARVSLDKIAELEKELISAQEGNSNTGTVDEPPGKFSSLTLENIRFAYDSRDENKIHFGPFNLSIQKGELLFLTGGNGSGKTTLAKLLSGLYQPTAGKRFLNGQAIDENHTQSYRNYFSTVFSDFHLFGNSPDLYNIERLTESELVSLFGLEGLLSIKDGKLSNKELSQGQRRRLALLLSMLDPRPVLVFDEPGSDLDPDFKHFFYLTILSDLKKQGKTVIVITHDDSYFNVADRVICLRNGSIINDSDTSTTVPLHKSENANAIENNFC